MFERVDKSFKFGKVAFKTWKCLKNFSFSKKSTTTAFVNKMPHLLLCRWIKWLTFYKESCFCLILWGCFIFFGRGSRWRLCERFLLLFRSRFCGFMSTRRDNLVGWLFENFSSLFDCFFVNCLEFLEHKRNLVI